MRKNWFLLLLVCTNTFAQKYISEGNKIKAKADSAFIIGKLDEAKQLYQKELDIYQKNKDFHRIALGNSNVSAIYLYKNEYDKAIALCKEGLKILPEKSETDTTRFRIHRFLGLYYLYKKQRDSADFHYQIAENLIDKSKIVANHSDIISFYSDMGFREMELVNLKKAEDYFRKAESKFHLDSLYNQAVIFHNLGLCYTLQKKFEEALKYYQKAEKLTREKNTLSYVLKEKANCLLRLHKYNEAKVAFSQAWRVYQENKSENNTKNDLYFEATYFNNLGYFESLKQNFKQAETYLNKSILIEKTQTKHSVSLSDSYRQLALVFENQHLFRQSLQSYQKAIIATHFSFESNDIYQNPALENILSERELLRAFIGKADVFRKMYDQTNTLNDLKTSLETYKLAISLAEKMRRSYQTTDAKLFFTENYFEVFPKAIEVAQQLFERTKNADYQYFIFDFSEKSRTATLNDALRDTEIKYKTIDANLLAKEKSLTRQLTRIQINLSQQKDSAKIAESRKKIVEIEFQLDRLSDKFEREFPNYYHLKYNSKSTTIKDIQTKILDEYSVFVSYFFDKENLFIFCITNSKSNIYKQTIDGSFVSKIQYFRNALANSPQGKKYNAQALSAELYKILISPIEKEIEGKKRLIIIRDAELNYLPFEVLAKQKDDYLLKKHIISYGYSASLLMTTEHEKKQGSGLLGFAPFANNSFQGSLFRDKKLGQLPKSADEVEKIGGDIYTEKEATKKRFFEKYRDKNIIHFATHAITDDNDPLKSFIAFYPENADYKLFTNELYDLDLQNAKLVMLSACETGTGKLQKGEGLMSLARAFSYAGANAVISTLWNAHDEASAHISERFYIHLKDGFKTDEALQKAKLDFLNSDLALRYEHPYYWANFILIGKAESIDFGVNWWVWSLGMALFIMIILFFYRRMVTRK